MKKRLAILLAAVLALFGLGLIGGVTPAYAQVRECVIVRGNVTITSPAGLGLAFVNDQSFSFYAFGTCASGGTWSVSGNGFGGCGGSSGSATLLINGAVRTGVTFQTAGTVIVVTGGGVTGGGSVVADPLVPNNSCANKTAHRFLLNGLVAV